MIVNPNHRAKSGESMSNLPKVTKNFVLLLPLLVAPAYSSPHLMINWNNYAHCSGKDRVYWRKNSYVLKNVHVLLVGTKEVQIQENFAGEAVELFTLSPSLKETGGWQDQGTGETFIGCTYLTKAVFRYHLSVAWLSTFDAGLGIWNNTI